VLWRRAEAGRRVFTDRDLEEYLPNLRRYALVLTRTRSDRDAADDLVQATAERAWAKRRLFQSGTNLQAWLFTILYHQCADDVRRSAARPFNYTVGANDETVGADDPMMGLAVRDMRAAIARLDAGQRRVLALITYRGLSYTEVATLERIPLGTVRSRLRDASGGSRCRIKAEGEAGERPEAVLKTSLTTPSRVGACMRTRKWRIACTFGGWGTSTRRSRSSTTRRLGSCRSWYLSVGKRSQSNAIPRAYTKSGGR